MARKSMIEPTLPRGDDNTEESILGRIIAHDREQSGRAAPENRDTKEENVTTLQHSFVSSNDSSTVRRLEIEEALDSGASKQEPQASIRTKAKKSTQPANQPGITLEERQASALQRAQEDEIAVVTVRAPQKLNGYIDRYVERVNRINPKRRYRKQDAVSEMFAWFYASHPMPPAPDEEDL